MYRTSRRPSAPSHARRADARTVGALTHDPAAPRTAHRPSTPCENATNTQPATDDQPNQAGVFADSPRKNAATLRAATRAPNLAAPLLAPAI